MKGYTKIPNNFLEWIISQDFETVDYKVLLFVFRKTIGWGKESDKISLSQFVTGTGASKRAIIYSIERLVQARTLVRTRDRGRTNTYRLVQSATLVLVQSKVTTSAIGGSKLVSSVAHTKDNTKETIQKDFNISSKGLKLDSDTGLVKKTP